MEITKGNGEMEMVRLRAAGKSQVEIYSFGAHLTSWVDAGGNEKIYTSPAALYNGEKAIRGGIPICFPQFAKRGPLKQHGFARTSVWTIDRSFLTSGQPAAKFILSDTDDTRRGAWPYKFEVSVVFRLSDDGNKLSLELGIMNKDELPFTFTIALHSYFTCPSEDVVLTEYDTLMYMDNTDGLKEKQQKGSITFEKEVDRVYVSSLDKLSIRKADLSIEKMNLPDAVVWNPHKEKAAALSDMPDDDWKSFICIEPARIASPATVHPAETWTCSLVLSVS